MWDFWTCLGADSILSVNSGIKGQERWTDRQITSVRPPRIPDILRWFDEYKPNVILFLETPFHDAIYKLAPEHGIKTVAIPMHETFSAKRLAADLLICPCYEAYEKARQQRKKLVFLPISVKPFPFIERTGHTFVMNVGFGWHADRRQVGVVVKAFEQLEDPEAKLILHAQQRFPEEVASDDKRIEWRIGNTVDPADNYKDGDILLAPMAFEGYGRTVLEGMASGMPTLTTNADPMNLFQHDRHFLIDPCERRIYSGEWVKGTMFNRISVEDMKKKLEWLLTIDTPKHSRWARKQAEAQSWEGFDYKSVWRKVLAKA